jgi:hypothetical protein
VQAIDTVSLKSRFSAGLSLRSGKLKNFAETGNQGTAGDDVIMHSSPEAEDDGLRLRPGRA